MVQKYLYTTLRYNFSFVCIIESYTKFFFQRSFQIDRSKIIQTKLNKNIFDKERKKKQNTWLHRYDKKKKSWNKAVCDSKRQRLSLEWKVRGSIIVPTTPIVQHVEKRRFTLRKCAETCEGRSLKYGATESIPTRFSGYAHRSSKTRTPVWSRASGRLFLLSRIYLSTRDIIRISQSNVSTSYFYRGETTDKRDSSNA